MKDLVGSSGLHRVRDEDGLIWRDDDGIPVTDAAQLSRLKALAVPPAWQHVWASWDPEAVVQATGLDARGRTQYRYLPAAVREHVEVKFGHLSAFAAALPSLHHAVAADLAKNATTAPAGRRAVLAAMVRLTVRFTGGMNQKSQ